MSLVWESVQDKMADEEKKCEKSTNIFLVRIYLPYTLHIDIDMSICQYVTDMSLLVLKSTFCSTSCEYRLHHSFPIFLLGV